MSFCTSCGKKVENWKFCVSCGAQIRGDENAEQEQYNNPVQNQTYSWPMPKKNRQDMYIAIAVIAAVIVIGAVITALLSSSRPNRSSVNIGSGANPTTNTIQTDVPNASRLVGTWESSWNEERILKLNKDGTFVYDDDGFVFSGTYKVTDNSTIFMTVLSAKIFGTNSSSDVGDYGMDYSFTGNGNLVLGGINKIGDSYNSFIDDTFVRSY